MRCWGAAALALALAGCKTDLDAREALLASTMARADAPMIISRPELVRGKYERMRGNAYDFYRGTLPIFWRDAADGRKAIGVSSFDWARTLVVGLGDPHPENFGILQDAQGQFFFEPNDFDAADVWPALWDVRRMLVGIELATRASNPGNAEQAAIAKHASESILRAALESYVDHLIAWHQGASFELVGNTSDTVLADLFRRSTEDAATRKELSTLVVDDGDARRFKFGVDPEEPTHVIAPLPQAARDALAPLLRRYAETLSQDFGADYFRVVDAARELGSGVASWPRVRVLVLVRGPSDDPGDDVVLEIKELADSGARGWIRPSVYADDVQTRIRHFTNAIWMRDDADPRWNAGLWLGFPVQIRTESEGQKSLRVRRLVDARGTPAALQATARALGEIVARAHSRALPNFSDENAHALAAHLITERDAFIAEQIGCAQQYADEVERDHIRFAHVLDIMGPTLGTPTHADDAPSLSLSALLALDVVAQPESTP